MTPTHEQTCKICRKTFPTVPCRKEHFKTCKRQTACPKCKKSVKDVGGVRAYNVHECLCAGPNVLKCPICEKMFEKSKCCLDHYYRCSTKEKCRRCGEKFPTKEALLVHVQKEHNDTKCPVCFGLFLSKGQLTEHMTKKHHNSE